MSNTLSSCKKRLVGTRSRTSNVSMQRIEEIADLILWLSSDKATFIIGRYHPVDGDYLAK